ncbi:amino acid transporter [Parathielavia appendiculata]|uniref:Amino acid transporter n=1 Tax=Parathielavia appendiculata TaxID=2587402 RepID=A0AAN6TZR3_9PEZI|nr:amino acid transporter [Parathielavia appendiculata]
MTSRNPTNWDEYDRGGFSRTGSVSSFGNGSGQSENESLLGRSTGSNQDQDESEWTQRLRRRRSSITNRLTAITDIGGVNSIRSFTRSWQRAAGFPEVIPQRPSFVFAPDQAPIAPPSLRSGDASPYARQQRDVEAGESPSLLRQHLEAALQGPGREVRSQSPRTASPDPGTSQTALHRQWSRESREGKPPLEGGGGDLAQAFRVGSYTTSSGGGSLFAVPPHLATPPLVGSYGESAAVDYGTLSSDVGGAGRASMAQAAALWRQQQEAGGNVPDGELPPILVKEVEQDGKIVLAVEGQSTLPQTVFNSTNVLIGVGLLSLPMGMKYAGWICGMIALFLCAAVTGWTAKILAKCMDLDPTLITFSDLAFISFGRNARIATSVLFTLELVAACVALIVLFADSLDLLFPRYFSVTGWKVFCAVILIPLNFLPLRLLSFTSVIGIFSCLTIVLILVFDGLLKPTSPGSLIEPAQTYMFPTNWLTLPLSFGLLMSPWGGHGVFPNIYRDMRHPYKYSQALKITFSFTVRLPSSPIQPLIVPPSFTNYVVTQWILDATTAVAGLLMFGDSVRDEITSNILMESSYPRAMTVLMCLCIAIIPLTKIPLNARPIVATLEVLLGLHQQSLVVPASSGGEEASSWWSSWLVGRGMGFRGAMKVAVRVGVVMLFLGIAVVFPAFDSIMAFMGSALCFTICVTLPLAFYLKLFGREISSRERVFAFSVMTLSFVLSVVGTVWAFLPKSLIGAEPSAPELR